MISAKKRFLFFVLTLLFCCTTGSMANQLIPLIDKGASVEIPNGQTKSFNFGTLPQRDTTVLLKIKSRMDAKTLGGSMFFMRVKLNGRYVEAGQSRSVKRLVNKPVVSPVTPNTPALWYGGSSGAYAGWRVLYAPDFTSALTQDFYEGNPYELVWDVTDLTNPMSDNYLEITNTAPEEYKKHAESNLDLVIGEMTVETKPVQSPTMTTVEDIAPVINRGEPAAGAAPYQGQLLPGGGFTVRTQKNTFQFDSAFSYPNAGFNHLSKAISAENNQRGWSIKVDHQRNRVIAQGSDYRVERTLKWEKTHIAITDAITNLHKDAPLGLAVRNEMGLSSMQNLQVRIAGSPDPAIENTYAYGNPSVHVRLPDSGVGIIAKDDVFRNQAILYTTMGEEKSPVVGIRTEMLRLAPGETYSLQWAVYPVAGPDYYDFINLVRHDWKANFTVIGGWWWGYDVDYVLKTPLPELREFLKRNGVRYTTIQGGWLDPLKKSNPTRIGFGTEVLGDYFADYRSRVRRSADKLREALPGIKVMAYYDTLRDSSDNSQQKFPDSAMTNSNGDALYTDWNGQYSRSYTMIPTLKNSFGKAMLKVAQQYFDEMKLDGIYWDEMSQTAYDAPWLSYNNFDGHSCLLDPKTWTIQKEVSNSSLATLPFRLAVIDLVRKNNGVLLGNGPSSALAELHTGTQRMIEVQHNERWPYQGDLDTPLGYVSINVSWESFLRTFKQAKLPVTNIISVGGIPHDITPYLFPFTPIELHSGYLLGKERIIATHSGNYGWSGERQLSQIFFFNSEGKIEEEDFATKITSEARTNVSLKEQEAVVLKRIPITLSPASNAKDWSAHVSQVHYGEEKISLHADASNGGILLIHNGAFVLKNDETVSVQLGTNTVQKIRVKGGAVRIAIPFKFQGMIEVSR